MSTSPTLDQPTPEQPAEEVVQALPKRRRQRGPTRKSGECWSTHTLVSMPVNSVMAKANPVATLGGEGQFLVLPRYEIRCMKCGKSLDEVRKEFSRPPVGAL